MVTRLAANLEPKRSFRSYRPACAMTRMRDRLDHEIARELTRQEHHQA